VSAVRSTPGARSAWHSHGAAADHFMTHLSMTEGVGQGDKPETDWGAHVTDAEYCGEAL